jgi:hypothetical protein
METKRDQKKERRKAGRGGRGKRRARRERELIIEIFCRIMALLCKIRGIIH